MKEYNRATNEIHAPRELIEKTKKAVIHEEKRIEEERMQKQNKKIITFSRGLTVAAAAVAVVMISVPVMRYGFAGNNGTGGVETESEWQDGNDMQLMLGQEQENLEKIEKENFMIEQGSWTEIHPGAIPEESVEIEGISVFLYDAEEGIAAEFAVGDITYYGINEEGDREQLLSHIKEFLEN